MRQVRHAILIEAGDGYAGGWITVEASSVEQAIGKLSRRARSRVIYAELVR